MDNSVQIKVVNHLTGEITEREVKGADAAEQLYLELQASQKAIKIAMDKLLVFLDEWLGQDEEQKFADGHYIKRYQRETKTWTAQGLRSIGLDEDAIQTASKVNMTIAKQIVKESIERGDIKPNAIKELDASAEVSTSKPFVQIK